MGGFFIIFFWIMRGKKLRFVNWSLGIKLNFVSVLKESMLMFCIFGWFFKRCRWVFVLFGVVYFVSLIFVYFLFGVGVVDMVGFRGVVFYLIFGELRSLEKVWNVGFVFGWMVRYYRYGLLILWWLYLWVLRFLLWG